MPTAPVPRLPDVPSRSSAQANHARGVALEVEVQRALGAREGVVVLRNAVISVTTQTGRTLLTGIGGVGAPDLHVEVRTPTGVYASVWMECKAGLARRRPAQTEWHEAARKLGRHVYVVRSVEDATKIVDAFARGEVPDVG